MHNAFITAGVVGVAAMACGGDLETHDGRLRDEPAGASGPNAVLLEGTVYWGPTTDAPVDRAFVRFADATHATRCVVTGCDGKFSIRASADFTLPYFVGVERDDEPEAKTSSTHAVVRKMKAPIASNTPCSTCHTAAAPIHLFADEQQAAEMRLAPTGSCAPGAKAEVVRCPEDR